MNVEHEVKSLIEHIKRLGTKQSNGQYVVKYGVLFNDDIIANEFEALLGTLKSAKKKGLITYQGEILLQRVHDNVDVILLKEE
eukprot:gene5269-6560_t